MSDSLGSILHGAYGDYYEQMLCLKAHKASRPGTRLLLFFASSARLRELTVFDLSFADEIHLASDLPRVRVDRFLQFQVRDPELQADVLAGLEPNLRARIDDGVNRKPWIWLRRLDLKAPQNQIGLSTEGKARLPAILEREGLTPDLFTDVPTVGFLWRYRAAGGAISHRFQTSENVVLTTKSELFSHLQREYGAHILVAGMNVQRTDENRDRVDAKFTEERLSLDESHATYLKGLSWALELEIFTRCSLCLVMPSGFSEALWMRRNGPTVLVDPPPTYLLKALWNRIPLFDLNRPSEIAHQIRQPHTSARVLGHLEARGLLPLETATTGISMP